MFWKLSTLLEVINNKKFGGNMKCHVFVNVGEAHQCKLSKNNMHLIFGIPEGYEGYSLSVVSFIWSKKGLYLTSILYITHLFQASFYLLKLLKWQEWEQIHKIFLHIKFSIKFSIGSQTSKSNILLCFIMLWYSVQVYFVLLFNNHENFNFRYIFRTH